MHAWCGPAPPSHAGAKWEYTFRGPLEQDNARFIEVDAEEPGPLGHGIGRHGLDEVSLATRQAGPVNGAQDNTSCDSYEECLHREQGIVKIA